MLKRIDSVAIAGVCGKFARPENKKEGLHLLAEFGADAQFSADMEEFIKIVKGVENPYFIVERVGMDTESSYNKYPEFQVWEACREAILKEVE